MNLLNDPGNYEEDGSSQNTDFEQRALIKFDMERQNIGNIGLPAVEEEELYIKFLKFKADKKQQIDKDIPTTLEGSQPMSEEG